MNEFRAKVEKIKEKIKNSGIVISRVPTKTKDGFIKLANEEFAEDYGLCLKFLYDIYQGYFPTGHEDIEIRLANLEKELEELKGKSEKGSIKTLSGKKIR